MFNFSCVRIITEAERIQLCERIAEKISADYGCEKHLSWNGWLHPAMGVGKMLFLPVIV